MYSRWNTLFNTCMQICKAAFLEGGQLTAMGEASDVLGGKLLFNDRMQSRLSLEGTTHTNGGEGTRCTRWY